jgi:hypothetical protein
MKYYESKEFISDATEFIKSCCPSLGVTYDELINGKHDKRMRTARQYMLHVLCELYITKLQNYATILNRKRHGTILNLQNKFVCYYGIYPEYRDNYRVFFKDIFDLFEKEQKEVRVRIFKMEMQWLNKQVKNQYYMNMRADIERLYG